MAEPGLDESQWYYQLGGRALGPVSWREIERLLEDTFDAEDLLIARAGDDDWRSAREIIDEAEKAGAVEEDAEDASAEVEEEEPPEPLPPVHGLKPWLSQTSEVFADDLKEYIYGSIMLLALGSVSLMVCFPALHAGFYILALRRFDGEARRTPGFLDGFRYFGRTLALYVLLLLMALPIGVALVVGVAVLIVAIPDNAGFAIDLTVMTLLFWLAGTLTIAPPVAVGFFAVPLMVDRDLGAIDALKQSWAVTRKRYFSFLGMTIVFAVLSGLGWLFCWIGVLLTLPLLPVAQVCVYRDYFGRS
ncbi:MAG: GYF domain-containing protein [Armatimonadota bacterium]|jgi:hypothetical protein